MTRKLSDHQAFHPRTISPPRFTPFIGRLIELEKLTSYLKDGRSRVITILGEGGVGKTRLALAAADELLPHFPDGIWFVSLAGLQTAVQEHALDIENNIASAIAATLNLNFAAGDPPKQQIGQLPAPAARPAHFGQLRAAAGCCGTRFEPPDQCPKNYRPGHFAGAAQASGRADFSARRVSFARK